MSGKLHPVRAPTSLLIPQGYAATPEKSRPYLEFFHGLRLEVPRDEDGRDQRGHEEDESHRTGPAGEPRTRTRTATETPRNSLRRMRRERHAPPVSRLRRVL